MKKTKTVKEWKHEQEEATKYTCCPEECEGGEEVVDPNYEYCPTDEEDCEPEEEEVFEGILDRALEEHFRTLKLEEQGKCDGDYSEHITTDKSCREESISFKPKKQ